MQCIVVGENLYNIFPEATSDIIPGTYIKYSIIYQVHLIFTTSSDASVVHSAYT